MAAPPPITAWRDANAPRPNGVASVSPSITVTESNGTPSSEATTWAIVVSSPCPWEVTPASTVTAPDGSIRTVAPSWPVRTGLLDPQRLVPDRLDHLLEAHGVARAVVDQPSGRRVRQIAGADQIDAPDLHGVEPERLSAEIQHALPHERGRWSGHPTVRARGGGVRRHRGHLAAIVRELVR